MNTAIHNSTPNNFVQPSDNLLQSKAALPAGRHPGGPLVWLAWLAALLVFSFSAPSARAQGVPPGCSGSAIGISLFTSVPDVHIGDTLTYSVSVFNGQGGSPTSCDASNIVASLMTPDGVVHPLALRRTYLSHAQSDFYSNVVSYVVRAQDVRTDGTLRATAEDTAVIFQNDTPSMGGANQGVNTEVNLPCIDLKVECVGSVGENGAITFTGMVTNCGNTLLVGVTVTNYVNSGAFTVLFPTNLSVGQSASFSGSYIPTNPCLPGTIWLVARGSDQMTAFPRLLVSSNSATCSVVTTPGIKVTKVCPVGPVAPGQPLLFSGSVSNTGNVTLTNIVVVNDQPAPNTTVFTRASLAPGAVAGFTASYAAPTNCSVTDTLTATATSRCGVPVTSTASATCPITTTPGITVTEVCPVTPGVSGGSSSFSGVVRNSGNITLNNVVVVSDRPAPNTVVFTVASLAPGASAGYSGAFTVPFNVCSVTTVVRATGSDSCTGTGVTNTVSATCPITTAPAIAVTLVCPVAPSNNGGPITYSGTVRNSGNVTLSNIVVTGSQSSPPTVLTVPSLAPGASANFTASITAPTNACSVSSTVNARGSDNCSLVVVSNSASATCPLATNPRLIVTQNCPAGPVSPGGVVTYSGSVSNAGNITLTNIVVTNDRSGATPVFTSVTLLPCAITNFTGSYTVPAGSACSVTSVATATGRDICTGTTVSDTDSATCPVTGTPLIAVTLNCPVSPVVPGNSITFSGTVSNPGNVTLANVTVVDTQASPSTVLNLASLAPGASANFTATFSSPANACSVTSTVTARGSNNCSGAVVTDSESATCVLQTTPALVVRQNCPVIPVSAGGLLAYSGSVSNAGNITLTNVLLINSQTGTNVIYRVVTLPPGASSNFTGSYTVPLATLCSVSSTATATGREICAGNTLTNTATATCTLATAPAIAATLNCPAGPTVPGGVVTYSGTVRNTGNVTLNGVTVVNDQASPSTVLSVASLAPGASASFTASVTAALDACAVTSSVVVRGVDACTSAAVTNSATATCAITGTPLIAVTLNCPATPVVTGNSISFSGTVSNRGNVTLVNVTVVNNQASPSTVLTLASLAPGAAANFTATFLSPANVCAVTSTVTARGSNTCAAVFATATASATCTLLTTPAIIVTQNCPTNPASPGGVLNYSGTVRNAGNVTLTNIVVANIQAANTNGGSASFGTISPPLVPPVGTITDRFVIGNNFNGLTFANQDKGYAANQFYSLRREVSGSSTFVTINANGTVTGRFDAGNRNFDALTFAAPDVGYGPVIFYYLSHDNAGVSSFGTITPGGVVGVVADLFVAGNNFDALTFAATDVGYGANLFYYLRHDNNGRSTFGTINPALPGTVTDRFNVGTNFDALVFTATDVGYGANLFYYLRHDSNGRSTFGTISALGTVTDRFNVGTNVNELAFTTTDVGFAANLFYHLRGGGNGTGTNTTSQPVFALPSLAPGASANFTVSNAVPSGSACSVTTIATATARDICSGNTVTNITTNTCTLATAPAIAVTLNCPAGPAVPGGVVTYSGTVRNSGNVTLNNVTVVSSQASPSTVLTLASLAPGASASFTASFTAALDACAVSSSVIVRGVDACTSAAVTNSASATCPLVTTPRLIVTQNCPTSLGVVLSYTGSVSNAGNITLTNVIVRNDRTGGTVVYAAATLAPGSSATFTGSYNAPADACSVVSTVTATAADKCTGSNVVATATTTCPLPTNPRIVVTQTCPPIQVRPGGTLTYSGTVSNAGNATLTNVVVRNDRTGGTIVFSIASLAPRATAPFTGSYVVSTDCCVDTSTLMATGRDCNSTLVSDTATRTCVLLTAPAIVVTKVCPAEVWKPLAPGDRLTYSGVVSNSGNITLTDVTIASTVPTNGTRIFGPLTLAAGESVNYTASFIIPVDFCGTDTVTARGINICTLLPVTSSVTTTCPIMTTPGIKVTKICPAQPTAHGAPFVFTGSVSNSGNVTLTNVLVVNSQPAANTPLFGPVTLAPGATRTFSGSYNAPLDCCDITDTLTARGQDRCAGTLVTDTATQVCPLLTTPSLGVSIACPATPVAVGGLFEFSGLVTNTSAEVLTNVYVFGNLPAPNTVLAGPLELAPGESEFFTGSFTVVAGAAGLMVTASGLDSCQARTVNAAANCSGPITPPSEPRAITVVINGNGTVGGVANGQLLNLGESYTATAAPAAGSTFVNWSGGVSETSPSLTFVMQSNLVVIANFVFNGTNGSNQLRVITVVINGSGTVGGVMNGQLLNLGQSYTAMATPAAGSSFVNWSGGVSGTSPTLTFVMQSNLVVMANFVIGGTNGSNTFTPVAGTFKGLFFEPSEVRNESSGFFTFVIAGKGAYTASVLSAGRRYSTRGKLGSDGKATNSLARVRTNALTVIWEMRQDGPDSISGTVTDGRWVSGLMGDRAIFNIRTNPAPQAGKYTLIIPGTPGVTGSPEGDGYGTATVHRNGLVSFVGRLADGTLVTQAGGLSKHGDWPMYVSLSSGRGSLLGWLLFTNRIDDDLSGQLSWICPTNSRSKRYPAGFELDSESLGSRYAAPIGTNRVLEVTDGVVILSGGNLSEASDHDVILGPRSRVTNLSPDKLTLSFTPSSGLFKGACVAAGTTGKITFYGAVLQKANRGSGYHLGTNQIGRVVFRPALEE